MHGSWTESLVAMTKELTKIPGPVGHEDAVQDRLVQMWVELGAEVRRTAVGNVLAKVGGSGPRPSGPRPSGGSSTFGRPFSRFGSGLPSMAAWAISSSTAEAAAFTLMPAFSRRLTISAEGRLYCLASSLTRFLAIRK